jgi:hypothetical protein
MRRSHNLHDYDRSLVEERISFLKRFLDAAFLIPVAIRWFDSCELQCNAKASIFRPSRKAKEVQLTFCSAISMRVLCLLGRLEGEKSRQEEYVGDTKDGQFGIALRSAKVIPRVPLMHGRSLYSSKSTPFLFISYRDQEKRRRPERREIRNAGGKR